MPKVDDLYLAILKLAPNIPKSALYTKDDLISEVYLLATKKGLDQPADLKKLVREASYRKYRPKYRSHSTANLSAEELLLYCNDRVVNQGADQEPEEDTKPTLFDYLRAAYSILEHQ